MADTAATQENPVHSQPWDPFQLMDRLDEEALRRELDGVANTDLVYVVRDGGQDVIGLSKTGVEKFCMALVSQGKSFGKRTSSSRCWVKGTIAKRYSRSK